MAPEQLLWTGVVTVIVSFGVTLAGAVVARKIGLPKLEQEVTEAQSTLVSTLETSLREARAKITNLEADVARLTRERHACDAEVRRLRRDLRDTEQELLELYRQTGKRPPIRLTGLEETR